MAIHTEETPSTREVGPRRNLSRLGQRLDGWAELIEGMADKAPEVISAFHERVSGREMPNVKHESATVTPAALSRKQREYQLVHTPTGATLAAYIGQFGRDLYIAWDLFIRPVLNLRTLLYMLVAAAVLPTFCSLCSLVGGVSGLARSRQISEGVTSLFGSLFVIVPLWIGGVIFLAMIFGGMLMLAGLGLRGNPLAFFFRELDVFDADDIAAMTLGVHKSLLEAIDAVGINVKLLRVKEQFRGGRRDRLI